ncbi:MAG: peptide ABC transporter substrate-binding protein [Spirochaetaceae bacterium]|nr:peptide ABC transporter substrate-binding protein [Spirochaetaceae bacterium]
MKNKILSTLFFLLTLTITSEDFTVNMGQSDLQWNLFDAYNTTEAQVFTALHEGLVIYQPATNKPIPGAAESWELSEDKKSYLFTLRENLQYSNGDPITAQDFRRSWIRALDPQKGSRFASLLDVIQGATLYNQGEIDEDQLGIYVLSDRKLQVDLVEPAPQFLSILCHYSFALVHPVLYDLEDWSDLIHMPVSGPYRIQSRTADSVILEKNPYYWDADNVAMDRIILLFNKTPEAAMNLFNDYRIDWVFSGMDSSLLEDGNKIIIAPSFATSYYFFSNRQEPWNNPQIRRALALLLPWDEIYSQYMLPGNTLVPPIPQYPLPQGILEQNVEEAMELLEQEGYPQGSGLPEIVIRIDASQWGDAVPLIMKDTWSSQLQTTVKIESLPAYIYYDSLKKDDYTLGYISWVGDYADPMTFLQMWKSDSSFNDAGFNQDKYDELLSQAALEQGSLRYEKLSQAETLLLQGGEVLPVQHLPSIHLIDLRYIEGWYPNALDIHPFKDISRKPGIAIPGLASYTP